MDFQIALLLGQDGIVNGAIYGLMGAGAGAGVFRHARDLHPARRTGRVRRAVDGGAQQRRARRARCGCCWALAAANLAGRGLARNAAARRWTGRRRWCGPCCFRCSPARWSWLRPTSIALQALTTLLLVAPLGPLLYRLAYRPLADATVLMLLIVSVALHGVLVGLGLLFFGAEGSRTPAFSDLRLDLGGVPVTGQSLVVVGVTLVLVIALFRFFGSSMVGKALRATAMNRVGARLMGIPTDLSGDLSFALAALDRRGVGPADRAADHGVLRHRLPDRPEGLRRRHHRRAWPAIRWRWAARLLVGLLESFSSFWASAFKEVLVFTLIIPVLWWRSLQQPSRGRGRRMTPRRAHPAVRCWRWRWSGPGCPNSPSRCCATSACIRWWRPAW